MMQLLEMKIKGKIIKSDDKQRNNKGCNYKKSYLIYCNRCGKTWINLKIWTSCA